MKVTSMWSFADFAAMNYVPEYFVSHVTLAIATPLSLLGLYIVSKIQNSCLKSCSKPTQLHQYPITFSILQCLIALIALSVAFAVGFGNQIIPQQSQNTSESKFKIIFVFIFNLFRLFPTAVIIITVIGIILPPIPSLLRQRNQLKDVKQTQATMKPINETQDVADTQLNAAQHTCDIESELPTDIEVKNLEQRNFENTMVIFRFVTRGNSPDLIKTNLYQNWQILKSYARIRVEVVTDKKLDLNSNATAIPKHLFNQIVVPDDYTTPNQTLYKARALYFAAMNSQFAKNNPDCYIFHCDEESTVTDELLLGIKDFLIYNYGKIGHGCIIYRNEETSFQSYLCHLADNVRVGEDLGRHRFQVGLMRSSFCGLKGSFLLIPNQIEINHETSFDCCGKLGSIAEDSWWGIMQLQNSNKFAWCNGVLIEQSCFTIKDFIKQRKRWFSGAIALCKYHPAPWYYKLIFGFQTLCLLMLPLIITMAWIELITYDLILRSSNHLDQMLLNINILGASVVSSLYLIGNLLQVHKSYFEKAVTTIVAPCLFILLGTIEAFTVVLTLMSPDNTFEIVNKEGKAVKRDKQFLEQPDFDQVL